MTLKMRFQRNIQAEVSLLIRILAQDSKRLGTEELRKCSAVLQSEDKKRKSKDGNRISSKKLIRLVRCLCPR